jgi:outer membrane protein OmpA-like peptidoglycan-associated protein
MGPEGALCEESTKECQKLNRRVHLEMRKLATTQS